LAGATYNENRGGEELAASLNRRKTTESEQTLVIVARQGKGEDGVHLLLFGESEHDGVVQDRVVGVVVANVVARELAGQRGIGQAHETGGDLVTVPVSLVDKGDGLLLCSETADGDILVAEVAIGEFPVAVANGKVGILDLSVLESAVKDGAEVAVSLLRYEIIMSVNLLGLGDVSHDQLASSLVRNESASHS
jgi:hypothetical protein